MNVQHGEDRPVRSNDHWLPVSIIVIELVIIGILIGMM